MRLLRMLCGVTAVLILAAPASRAGSLQILYAFQGGKDGTSPLAGVIAQGGTLFGTTQGGGSGGCAGFGCGTVFRLDVASGAERVLYRFTDSPDAALPSVPLLRLGHVLYGTTTGGGTVYPGMGAVFAVDDRHGSETVLGSLGGTLGNEAQGGLTALGSALYGTTELGGTGNGTVFQVDPAGGVKVVYNFAGGPNDGASPFSTLVSHGGLLFGTTYAGGRWGFGTVFELNPTTGRETVLHNFRGGDGSTPAGLIYDHGQLYGVGEGGGNPSCILGCGTIFRIDLRTGAFSTLYSFKGGNRDGEGPDSLVLLNGLLYGTTGVGGPPQFLCEYGCGTIFQYDLTTNTENVLNFFTKLEDGLSPQGVIVSHGVLYGTTLFGGDAACEGGGGCGVVFAYTP